MTTWTSSPLQAPPQTEDVAELRTYLKTTINQFAIMMKNLDHVLNGNIDLKNVRAQSIDATRLDVDELSAISANIGEITAGIIRGIEIYGSLISTSDTVYPRVTLDPTSIAFSVMADPNNGIQMPAFDGGITKIIFLENGNQSVFFNSPSSGFLFSAFRRASITGSDGVKLDPGNDYVRVPSWDKLYNEDTLSTLQSELNAIWNAIGNKSNAGHTHSVTTTAGGGTFTTSSG